MNTKKLLKASKQKEKSKQIINIKLLKKVNSMQDLHQQIEQNKNCIKGYIDQKYIQKYNKSILSDSQQSFLQGSPIKTITQWSYQKDLIAQKPIVQQTKDLKLRYYSSESNLNNTNNKASFFQNQALQEIQTKVLEKNEQEANLKIENEQTKIQEKPQQIPYYMKDNFQKPKQKKQFPKKRVLQKSLNHKTCIGFNNKNKFNNITKNTNNTNNNNTLNNNNELSDEFCSFVQESLKKPVNFQYQQQYKTILSKKVIKVEKKPQLFTKGTQLSTVIQNGNNDIEYIRKNTSMNPSQMKYWRLQESNDAKKCKLVNMFSQTQQAFSEIQRQQLQIKAQKQNLFDKKQFQNIQNSSLQYKDKSIQFSGNCTNFKFENDQNYSTCQNLTKKTRSMTDGFLKSSIKSKYNSLNLNGTNFRFTFNKKQRSDIKSSTKKLQKQKQEKSQSPEKKLQKKKTERAFTVSEKTLKNTQVNNDLPAQYLGNVGDVLKMQNQHHIVRQVNNKLTNKFKNYYEKLADHCENTQQKYDDIRQVWQQKQTQQIVKQTSSNLNLGKFNYQKHNNKNMQKSDESHRENYIISNDNDIKELYERVKHTGASFEKYSKNNQPHQLLVFSQN